MTYRLANFDGLAITEYIQRGDEQNMGTGSAQTDFRQLPGGGFYRMRRGKRSPQGIRPITKSCVLWGADAADLRQQLDAWRAKIGVYGKLTIVYRDDEYRWQWAELQDVDAPVPASLKSSKYLPISLTWQTVAQNWNGLIQGAGWTVGDGSFYLGDGTAEVGQNSLLFEDLDADTNTYVSVTNNGNIDATNLVLTYNAGGAQSNVVFVSLRTGQRIAWTGTLAAGEAYRVSTRDMTAAKLGAAKTISSASRVFNSVTIVTSTVHGLTTGGDVEISGTTDYDGIWENVTVTNTTTFSFAIPGGLEAYGTETAGTVRAYSAEYANTGFYDAARWMILKAGVNSIAVQTGSSQVADSLLVEFFDSYA